MATYLVLDDLNVITNMIIADSLSIAKDVTKQNCVRFDPSQDSYEIGQTYTQPEA